MKNLVFLVVVGVLALLGFGGLLWTTLQLVDQGQTALDALTGSGSLGLGVTGFYRLLSVLVTHGGAD